MGGDDDKGATTAQILWGRKRAKPESRAKPEKERGRGLGRGLGEPLPRKYLDFRTSNRSIWCIVEMEILKLWHAGIGYYASVVFTWLDNTLKFKLLSTEKTL